MLQLKGSFPLICFYGVLFCFYVPSPDDRAALSPPHCEGQYTGLPLSRPTPHGQCKDHYLSPIKTMAVSQILIKTHIQKFPHTGWTHTHKDTHTRTGSSAAG